MQVGRRLYDQIVSNDDFFVYTAGMKPRALEEKMIARGDAWVWTDHFARAGFPGIEARYGYQPFRLAKKVFNVVTH